MSIHHIPEDIKAESLLDYLSGSDVKVSVKGLHKRNTCHDLLEVTESTGGGLHVDLARKSLYDILPEYAFHPYDRYGGLKRDEFEGEYEKQKEEIENAIAFFEPVDLALLQLKLRVNRERETFASTNKVLIDLIADSLSDNQRDNRFVKMALGFLPHVRTIRGNRMGITLMLRKIFEEEGLMLRPVYDLVMNYDAEPRYDDSETGPLCDTFAGNSYYEQVLCYEVLYWPKSVDSDFPHLVADIKVFESFIKDYFLSVEDSLSFVIRKDESTYLYDNERFHYLNYNTNL